MNQLEYILAVIEEKSITKAAKRLYITPHPYKIYQSA